MIYVQVVLKAAHERVDLIVPCPTPEVALIAEINEKLLKAFIQVHKPLVAVKTRWS